MDKASKEDLKMASKIEGKLAKKNFRKIDFKITDDEVEYFRQHPAELERITSTEAITRMFMIIAVSIGLTMILISKIVPYFEIIEDGMLNEIVVDLFFEGGVALWGGVATVFLLDIMKQKQIKANEEYKKKIRSKIAKVEQKAEAGEDDD